MPEYSHLLEALERRALILFLGADLPREVTGLPSRAELARGLAERHGVTGAPSLAQVAQRVSRAGNRFDFTDYLRRALDTAGKPVPAFYRGLAAFAQAHSLPAIITTAYDDFLDRALRDAGVPCDRLMHGSDVAFARPDRLALLKLYGDAQMPDTLVVTEDDHYGLWRDRDKEALLDEVRSLLKKQTVLFLGYNLSDPDFRLLWREVLDKLGHFARTAYAVWPGLPEEEQRVWRDRSIQVLESDPWGLTGGASPAAGAVVASPVVSGGVPSFGPAGPGSTALGAGAVQVGGNVGGDVVTGTKIETGGGAYVGGNVNTGGGDFVGRDQNVGARPGHEPPMSAAVADLPALRARLQRLDAVEIESLCLDHFPSLYDKFARGMQRGELINLLLDHCRRHPEEAARLARLLM